MRPSAPPEAPGVVYTEVSGLKVFRCEAYRATLTAKSCAARYAKAKDARGDMLFGLANCRSCPVGARHSGEGAVKFSRYHRVARCSRCGMGGRIIHGRLCISCANRQYELRKGVNARGNAPAELMLNPLRAVRLQVEVETIGADGVVTVAARNLRDPETLSVVETVVQFLKTRTGVRAFGWASPGVLPAGADAPTPEPDPLVGALFALMEGRAVWAGRMADLVAALSEVADDAGLSISHVSLGKQLRLRASALAKANLVVSGGNLENGRWGIFVTNRRIPADPAADPFVDAVAALVADREAWVGGYDDLRPALAAVAPEAAKDWPGPGYAWAQMVRRRMERVAKAGIRVESAAIGPVNGKRTITITRAAQDERGAEAHADHGEPEPPPAAAAAPESVADVAEAEIATKAPEWELFDCTRLRARMTQRGCSDRWVKAQAEDRNRRGGLAGCRRCAIGAAHAGAVAMQA